MNSPDVLYHPRDSIYTGEDMLGIRNNALCPATGRSDMYEPKGIHIARETREIKQNLKHGIKAQQILATATQNNVAALCQSTVRVRPQLSNVTGGSCCIHGSQLMLEHFQPSSTVQT